MVEKKKRNNFILGDIIYCACVACVSIVGYVGIISTLEQCNDIAIITLALLTYSLIVAFFSLIAFLELYEDIIMNKFWTQEKERFASETMEPYITSKREELIASGIDPDSEEMLKNLSCNRCGHCCMFGSCYLSPEDLETLSNYFKIPPEQVIETYLVWDLYYDSNAEKEFFYLRPMRKTTVKTTDNCVNYDIDFSNCIFLETIGNVCSCKIHEVMPKGAKTYFCAIPRNEENRKLIYLRENAIKDFLHHPLNPYPEGLKNGDD